MYVQKIIVGKRVGSVQVAVSGSEQHSHKGVLGPSTRHEQTLKSIYLHRSTPHPVHCSEASNVQQL